jgi:hypothetical protein
MIPFAQRGPTMRSIKLSFAIPAPRSSLHCALLRVSSFKHAVRSRPRSDYGRHPRLYYPSACHLSGYQPQVAVRMRDVVAELSIPVYMLHHVQYHLMRVSQILLSP